MAALVTTMVLASCTTKGVDSASTNPGSTTSAESAAPTGADAGLGESDTPEAADPETTAPQDSIPRISQSESSQYLDDQWHDVADREGPDTSRPSSDAGDCIALADMPFTPRTLIGDPIDDLASGRTPSVFGTQDTLDEVVKFETFEDYPDPSTPTDLYGLIEAWTAAGFDGRGRRPDSTEAWPRSARTATTS